MCDVKIALRYIPASFAFWGIRVITDFTAKQFLGREDCFETLAA